MHDLDLLDVATTEIQRRVDLLSAGDLDRPTPCDEWDVRFLLAHLVGGNRFASMVLRGSSVEDAMGRIMTTRQLGPDPARDFAESAFEQRQCFREPSALASDVEHPIGVVSGGRFLRFRIFDCAVHAWDLASALGVDTDLDPELVSAALEIVRSEPPGMGFAIDQVPADRAGPASALDELLALSGRTTGPHS